MLLYLLGVIAFIAGFTTSAPSLCIDRVSCYIDPCLFPTCQAVPGAVCESDYCGGCYANFYLKGILLTQEQCNFGIGGLPKDIPVTPENPIIINTVPPQIHKPYTPDVKSLPWWLWRDWKVRPWQIKQFPVWD